MYGLLNNVRVVPVIPGFVYVFVCRGLSSYIRV